MLLLAWIYYSSQIFFAGAEFTKAYAALSAPPASARPKSGEQTPLARAG